MAKLNGRTVANFAADAVKRLPVGRKKSIGNPKNGKTKNTKAKKVLSATTVEKWSPSTQVRLIHRGSTSYMASPLRLSQKSLSAFFISTKALAMSLESATFLVGFWRLTELNGHPNQSRGDMLVQRGRGRPLGVFAPNTFFSWAACIRMPISM